MRAAGRRRPASSTSTRTATSSSPMSRTGEVLAPFARPGHHDAGDRELRVFARARQPATRCRAPQLHDVPARPATCPTRGRLRRVPGLLWTARHCVQRRSAGRPWRAAHPRGRVRRPRARAGRDGRDARPAPESPGGRCVGACRPGLLYAPGHLRRARGDRGPGAELRSVRRHLYEPHPGLERDAHAGDKRGHPGRRGQRDLGPSTPTSRRSAGRTGPSSMRSSSSMRRPASGASTPAFDVIPYIAANTTLLAIFPPLGAGRRRRRVCSRGFAIRTPVPAFDARSRRTCPAGHAGRRERLATQPGRGHRLAERVDHVGRERGEQAARRAAR